MVQNNLDVEIPKNISENNFETFFKQIKFSLSLKIVLVEIDLF